MFFLFTKNVFFLNETPGNKGKIGKKGKIDQKVYFYLNGTPSNVGKICKKGNIKKTYL